MKKNITILFFIFLGSFYTSAFASSVYPTSEAFLKAEGQTCKIATDGCNTIQIINGQLGASTKMYCEDMNTWSCIDKKLEEQTIGFLTNDEQIEYKDIKNTLNSKIISKVESIVNHFGDKVLVKTKYDMNKSYIVMDTAIAKVEMHLMTSKYSNQNIFKTIRLLRFELMILKNRWEQNSGVTTSN